MTQIPLSNLSDQARFDLVREVVQGNPDAATTFCGIYRPVLEQTLGARSDSLCSRHGIPEILDQLIAECVAPIRENKRTGGPAYCLLEKYLHPKNGGIPGPFLAWLRTVANNRFNDWVEQNCRFVPSVEDMESSGETTPEHVDADEAALVGEALKHGFSEAIRQQPMGIFCLLLTEVHQLQGQQVAGVLGICGGSVTHAKARAGKIVREETMSYLRQSDPLLELDWHRVMSLLGSDFLGSVIK